MHFLPQQLRSIEQNGGVAALQINHLLHRLQPKQCHNFLVQQYDSVRLSLTPNAGRACVTVLMPRRRRTSLSGSFRTKPNMAVS